MPRDLVNYSPNSVWDFMREMDRAFDDFWSAPQATSLERKTGVFTPAVDVREIEDSYLVCMDVPGIPRNDIKINVQNGRLMVSGERSHEAKQEDKKFKRIERSFGSFERTFQLPQDVNADKIQARCENGVLEIMLPKAEVAKPRSIQIDTEKGGLFSRLLGQKSVEPSSKTAGSEKQSSPMSAKH